VITCTKISGKIKAVNKVKAAGRSITKGAERRQQHGQEDVNPLVSFPLDHAEQATLDHLQRVGLYIRQNKQ